MLHTMSPTGRLVLPLLLSLVLPVAGLRAQQASLTGRVVDSSGRRPVVARHRLQPDEHAAVSVGVFQPVQPRQLQPAERECSLRGVRAHPRARRTLRAVRRQAVFLVRPVSIHDRPPASWPSASEITRRTMLVALASPPLLGLACRRPTSQGGGRSATRVQISGIYPHLAVYNDIGGPQDRECGIGAVVPWAGRLWLMTYPPHQRMAAPTSSTRSMTSWR